MSVKSFAHFPGSRAATAGLIGLVSFVFVSELRAQWVIPQSGSIIDFDNTISGVNNGAYNGTAPATNPGAGMLDSDAWAFQLNPTFQGTARFGGFFGFNVQPGVYGFDGGQNGALGSGRELGFAPPNGPASPFGSFSLTTVNGTGSAISQINLSLDFNYFNATNRGVTLNVSYTIGGVTTGLGNLTFVPTNSQFTIAGTHLSSGLVNLGASVANGGQIQFNFTLATNGSSNSIFVDQVGIDNIDLSFSVPEPGTCAVGVLALGVLVYRLRRRGMTVPT
jgi:PEP-CTERM motif